MIVEFGKYQLDMRSRKLRCCGEGVRIQPKALDLLILLAHRRGRFVSPKEIARAL
jgi:DNA-binding winged helix-turn-helix (wHTH) protein